MRLRLVEVLMLPRRLVFTTSTLIFAASLAWGQVDQPPMPVDANQDQQLAAGPQQQQPLMSPDQLSNLVAPVALYPDPLLGQVLAASTYPLELIEANQWVQRNGNLRGQQLTDAARQQPWDPSVQALVAFPDVLAKL